MAKGLDKHKERQQLLSSFGKQLTRRAKSCCELCSQNDVKLSVFEFNENIKEVVFENLLFICETCENELNKKKYDSNYWKFLLETVWSEEPIIQAQAVVILKKLSIDNQWATDILDQVYLSPEVEELLF